MYNYMVLWRVGDGDMLWESSILNILAMHAWQCNYVVIITLDGHISHS